MRLLPAGESAVLVELATADQVLPLVAGLRAGRLGGVLDIVPAERTVLVAFDPAVAGLGAVRRWVETATPQEVSGAAAGAAEIAVRYDGADLADVARLLGVTSDEVVRQHHEVPWTVAFCGFAPGFAYLRPPDGRLAVPRRETPRTRIPAGAVALAAGYAGIYPRASPGGWHLIGRTDAVLWDATREAPALLQPGMQVTFVDAR